MISVVYREKLSRRQWLEAHLCQVLHGHDGEEYEKFLSDIIASRVKINLSF